MVAILKSFLSYINVIGLKGTFDYIIQRFVTKKDIITIKVPGILNKIKLRRNSKDINVFQQIFIKDEFRFLKSEEYKIIIDCGANIGLSTVYFKHLFPDAQIFSIEPEINNFKMLELNTSPYEGVTLINKAVSNNSEDLYLIDVGNGSDAYQTKKWFTGSEEIKKTASISIKELISRYNICKLDLIKMDIEGAEEFCLTEDSMDWISITKTLAVEIHENLIPGIREKIERLLHKDFLMTQQGEYSVFINFYNPS